jgi:hypothetical protein
MIYKTKEEGQTMIYKTKEEWRPSSFVL